MDMQAHGVRREINSGYKVDVSRGERIGRVSSEWFSRPDSERYPVSVGAGGFCAQPDTRCGKL